MRVETITLGLLAAAASSIAFLAWRSKVRLLARIAELDSENERLRSALIARKDRESGQLYRLEHDLKSPLGVILGFSTLLREYLEGHYKDLPQVPLRSINGIDQAARKMVQIIEAAADGTSCASGEEAMVEEKSRS
jgi:signal transduction histidine kinase